MKPRGPKKRRGPALGLALALPLLGASVTGCIIDTEPVPTSVIVGTQPSSVLVVDWTIELRRDSRDCVTLGAASIQIFVLASSGVEVGTFEQACATFATSISLAAGTYSATAQLIDSAGQARTTAATIAPFTLFGNDELHTPVDFPATSFY